MRSTCLVMACVVLVLCAVGGCARGGAAGGPVTLEKAKAVRLGMAETEVMTRLGPCTKELPRGVRIWYQNPEGGSKDVTGIIVGFTNGKVDKVDLTGEWKGK